ncbi:MAG: flagellar basal body rod protein FlgB [Desulfuromonas sp.]|nr:flagellar basal body rod protein FlgB [Desulfuromonas sp.]
MSSRIFTDKATLLLEKNLNLRLQNQQLIASNVANAQTPGYSAKRLEFQSALRQAADSAEHGMTVTDPMHISPSGGSIESVQGQVKEVNNSQGIGDGNSVDVNQEMVLMAQNQLMYEASVQLLNKKMSIIKYVVQGN